MKDLIGRLAARLSLKRSQVERTVTLFDGGNTIPFVARYRKEITDGLDEEALARFQEELNALRKLSQRQETVLKSIESQGALTPQLEEAIEAAETLQVVEDLYLPYKPKRQTRAQKARERGLEPVAGWILQQLHFEMSREEAVYGYINEEVPTFEDAWQGARDIVAEIVSDDARARDIARRLAWDNGQLTAALLDPEKDPKKTYELYYDFQAWVKAVKPHQVLALNRGEAAGVLRVSADTFEKPVLDALLTLYPPDPASPLVEDLMLAVKDGYKRLIAPAIEREVRTELKEQADVHAINIFATNLRSLLFSPPLKDIVVLGIDPGFRTGCKIAVVDATGRLLRAATIYPHEPQSRRRQALDTLHEMIKQYKVDLVAVGNGTASRETEELAAQLISEGAPVKYLIVSEAGASVYSASPLARVELPNLDVSLRGAVSIARRAQDPLAELIKIDPKSIGVGMYQHDVDQKALHQALDQVTEWVVNAVGVDVNTASPALLKYVAGVGPKTANNIVSHRDENGPFRRRADLLKVPGMGARTFEQAAGFLRVPGGEEPLDATGIHPESYGAVEGLFEILGASPGQPGLVEKLNQLQAEKGLKELAKRLDIGVPTLIDIIRELQKPGRDPREEVPAPLLREDVLRIEDLRPGMRLSGTVRNVVDFGAFVDIGVKQDGLIHVSQMADRRVESPYDVVSVGDVIEVTVVNIDIERGRIGLSMRA